MIVSVSDHASTSGQDPIISEDGLTLFGEERPAGKLRQLDSVTRVEVNRIARTWSGASTNPWLKWGIAVLTYILVVLAAFLLSFREKYESIITSTSLVPLDTSSGGTQAPATSTVMFPMLLLLIDTTDGAGWDAYPSAFITGGNIMQDALGPQQICDLSGYIRRKNVGNYEAYLLDLPSASNCSISVPSQYLRIITSYRTRTSNACLSGAIFPPDTSMEVINDTIIDGWTSSVLQYLSDSGQTIGTISPSTTVFVNGTASTNYGLSFQWVPSLYLLSEDQSTTTTQTTVATPPSRRSAEEPGLVSSVSTSSSLRTPTVAPLYRSVLRRSVPIKRERDMVPIPGHHRRDVSHGVLDLSLRYESFLAPITTQRRQMTRVDVFFQCLALLGVLSVAAQLVDAVTSWWNRRNLSKKERLD